MINRKVRKMTKLKITHDDDTGGYIIFEKEGEAQAMFKLLQDKYSNTKSQVSIT